MTRLPTSLIKINGVDEEIAAATIGELLAARGIDPGAKFLAVAVNGAVVRRANWAELVLNPGDSVEIVRPLQGG
jgi:sulfur carrier protein